ncbi:Hypothetical predicted protein [Paramuricea clavata]|nr:Hypothetical predicted protein [Paramuricea clavata]
MAKSAHDAVEKSHIQIDKPAQDVGKGRQMLKWKVYFHFVGATPGSTDLAFFLQRLTKELNPRKTDVVSDLDSLVQLANSLLSNPNTPPTIVFVDAVNQMDSDKLQYLTRWLPEVVSPNVRIVLSMIDETECHRLLRSYKTNPTEIIVGELDYESRKAIVVNTLSRYNKRLDDEQMKLLLSKKGSANPLWLSLACEELRVYGVFKMVNEKIQSLSDDLLSLEEQVLTRFEEENGGQLVIATVCLLETSRHGLLETDSRREHKPGDDEPSSTKSETQGTGTSDATEALADKLQEKVNIAYVQTGESKDDQKKQDGEKTGAAGSSQKRRRIHLPAVKWAIVYRALKPLLRPCGDLGEGRLDFYHRSISKAVRRKYFGGEEAHKKHMYTFWHGRLAEFFEHCEDFDRKSEELPYHLEQLLDNNRLTRCLLDWPVFERLFSEDFSVDLLRSWQKAGGYAAASNLYRESLNILEGSGASAAEIAERKFMVITFLIQAGQYKESLELLEELRKIEEEQMGARTEKMAEIYQLMSKTKSEIVKNYNFVTQSQLKEDREIVEFCHKCISYREKLSGDENEFKCAMVRLLIAHHLSIVADLERSEAKRKEAFTTIELAIAVFKKQNDTGHLAEAIMTKSFINPRLSKHFHEKEKMLMTAQELCAKTYGEKHMLMLRLFLNIGILYEDNRNFETAFDYFIKWHDTCIEVLGPSHPKTKRAQDTLKEPTYVRIAKMREQQAAGTA